MTPSDLLRSGSAPFDALTEHQLFDVDTSPDSMSLAAGAYEVFNAGTVLVLARLGAAASLPTDKGSAVAGQVVIPAGGSVALSLASAETLHAVVQSGTATLHLLRKVL